MFNHRSKFMYGCVLVLLILTLACGEKSAPPESNATAELVHEKAPEPSKPTAPQDYNKDELGRALSGYDAVAYHTQGQAVAGIDTHSYAWGGVNWLFANPENLALFKENPDTYAPANGGYCTFGIILNKKLDGNPEVWHLKENKLHMFLNTEVRGKFLLDEHGNLQKVADNWPSLKNSAP